MTNNNYYPIDIPKTAIIAYYNPETDQNLNIEEWKQLNSRINPSEVRIVNKGEVYVSLKAGVDYPAYGPGLFDDVVQIAEELTNVFTDASSNQRSSSSIAPFRWQYTFRNNMGYFFEISGIHTEQWKISGNLDELWNEWRKIGNGEVKVVKFNSGRYERDLNQEIEVNLNLAANIAEFRSKLRNGRVEPNTVYRVETGSNQFVTINN